MFLNASYVLYIPTIDTKTRLASYKRIGAFSCYEELENGGDNAHEKDKGELSIPLLELKKRGLEVDSFKIGAYLLPRDSQEEHLSLKAISSLPHLVIRSIKRYKGISLDYIVLGVV